MSRFAYVLATYFATMAMIVTAFIDAPTWLVWNTTASVPVGFYRLHPIGTPAAGDLVAVRPDAPLARYLARRGYLPMNVPLLKRVAAAGGQQVCRLGVSTTIAGRYAGAARGRDGVGRPLPVWSGCRRIAAGEVFLMNVGVPDSLDGRYFGPISTHSILGRATPLWTDPPREPAPAGADARPSPQRTETSMLHIGTFHRTATGFAGRLETLTLSVELHLITVDPGDNDNAPNYRIYRGDEDAGVVVGAGWNRVGRQSGAFVGVEIDDPTFGQPINAGLFQDDADGRVHTLVFRRPPRRKTVNPDAEARS